MSDKTIAFRYNIYYDCTVEVAGKSSRVGRVEYVLVEGDAHGRVRAIFSVVSVYGKKPRAFADGTVVSGYAGTAMKKQTDSVMTTVQITNSLVRPSKR